jgi:translation initiation factor eIF-2B subunit gamma
MLRLQIHAYIFGLYIVLSIHVCIVHRIDAHTHTHTHTYVDKVNPAFHCVYTSKNSCTIQNTVVCSGVTIESNCNLNECSIGVGSKITAGSKIKGESISATS